jgi:hypothetical protein
MLVQQPSRLGHEDPRLDLAGPSRDARERAVGALDEQHPVAGTRDQPRHLWRMRGASDHLVWVTKTKSRTMLMPGTLAVLWSRPADATRVDITG